MLGAGTSIKFKQIAVGNEKGNLSSAASANYMVSLAAFRTSPTEDSPKVVFECPACYSYTHDTAKTRAQSCTLATRSKTCGPASEFLVSTHRYTNCCETNDHMKVLFLVLCVLGLCSACQWPSVDALFIIDSTLNVNEAEHKMQIDFIRQSVHMMELSSTHSRVAVAQFTPKAQIDLPLSLSENRNALLSHLNTLSYFPCDASLNPSACAPMASINSLAQTALANGNRKWVPDIIVVISTSKYVIPQLQMRETLMSPISPIIAFRIIVGDTTDPVSRFEPAAATVKMTAAHFSDLQQLTEPLCESVDGFLGDASTSRTIFGPLCWTITGILAVVFVLVLLFLCFAVYNYRDESEKLKRQLANSECSLRRQNEYFTAKLHTQMEEQIKVGEQHKEDIKKQQEQFKVQQEELEKKLEDTTKKKERTVVVPYYPGDRPRSRDDLGTASVDERDLGFRERYRPRRENEINHRSEQYRHRRRNDRHSYRDGCRDYDDYRSRPGRGASRPRTGYYSDDDRLREEREDGSDDEGKAGSDGRDRSRSKSPKKGTGGATSGRNQNQPKEENVGEGRTKRHNLEESTISFKPGRHQTNADEKTKPAKDADGKENKSNGQVVEPLDLGESTGSKFWKTIEEQSESSEGSGETGGDSDFSVVHGHLALDHPSRTLPPIDLLFLVDSSSSIGISNFESIKTRISAVVDDVDVSPGRSRVALVQYAQEPSVVFGFDKYYSVESVKKGIMRMSYTGGATMLAKALAFAAGLLYKEQNMKGRHHRKHKLMPTPKHDRLQILGVVSDGSSEDHMENSTGNLHERLHVKIFAMVTRSINKDKLLPITRFDGSIFVMDQKESIAIWMWRQQKLWFENYGAYVERERSMPLSKKATARSNQTTALNQSLARTQTSQLNQSLP